MTCNGCCADVENKLAALPQGSNATVNLANEEAVIQSDKKIAAAQLKQILPAK
jgi:copper chaperone CopZ